MVMYNKSEEDVNCMKSTTFLCAASTCNDTHIYHHYIINAKFTVAVTHFLGLYTTCNLRLRPSNCILTESQDVDELYILAMHGKSFFENPQTSVVGKNGTSP